MDLSRKDRDLIAKALEESGALDLAAKFRKPTLHIEGRRWFQRGPGNTYHSVRIYMDGEQVAHLPYQYGYGEQFLQTAWEWLGANGMPELLERHSNGGWKNYGTQYLREVLGNLYLPRFTREEAERSIGFRGKFEIKIERRVAKYVPEAAI